jgi:phosphate transport system substrate-binding protein
MTARRSVRAVFALVGVLAILGLLAPAASAEGSIDGAGSSFPQLEIEQWRSDVSRKPYSIKVTYASSGSTFGRNQYTNGLVDFGVSDIPFQADELDLAAKRPYTYVTVSAGGVGFMYNLKDTSGRRIGFAADKGGTGTDLKLTPRTVCRLFTEPDMRWNDTELKADNPDINLPNKLVKPVLRQDGSGTGYVVQEFCMATAKPVWDAFVDYVRKTPVLSSQFEGDPLLNGQPSSRWPAFAGQTAFASDGVANVVASDTAGDGGITYVEAGFAEVRGFPNALVSNAAGIFHYPEAKYVNTALKYATQKDDKTVTLSYTANDPDAYFPSSYSYAIVPTSNISADKANALATFLYYAVTKGQEKADKLGYAPLSREIVDISLGEIQRIPGAPPPPEVVTFQPGSDSGGVSGDDGTPGAGPGTGDGGPSGPATQDGGTGPGTDPSGASNGDAGQDGAAQSGGDGGAGNATRTGTGTAPGGATSGPAATTATGSANRTGNVASPANRRGSTQDAVAAAAAIQPPARNAPSNSDIASAVLQGAAICAAGALLARRWQQRVKGSP